MFILFLKLSAGSDFSSLNSFPHIGFCGTDIKYCITSLRHGWFMASFKANMVNFLSEGNCRFFFFQYPTSEGSFSIITFYHDKVVFIFRQEDGEIPQGSSQSDVTDKMSHMTVNETALTDWHYGYNIYLVIYLSA